MATRRELESMFRPAPEVSQQQKDQIERIRLKAIDLAAEFNPTDSRGKSLALTKLQESVFWAVWGVTHQ